MFLSFDNAFSFTSGCLLEDCLSRGGPYFPIEAIRTSKVDVRVGVGAGVARRGPAVPFLYLPPAEFLRGANCQQGAGGHGRGKAWPKREPLRFGWTRRCRAAACSGRRSKHARGTLRLHNGPECGGYLEHAGRAPRHLRRHRVPPPRAVLARQPCQTAPPSAQRERQQFRRRAGGPRVLVSAPALPALLRCTRAAGGVRAAAPAPGAARDDRLRAS